jgi:probable rRNA maturation factor
VSRGKSASCLVSAFNAHRGYRIEKKKVQAYVKRVLGRTPATISVVFVNSHRCKAINRTFLNHNYVTDVISFVLETKPVLEGEIYVNLDRAKQQAREYGVSFSNEVARLVIHGALHIIGYDDTTSAQRKKMKAVEDQHVRYWFDYGTE